MLSKILGQMPDAVDGPIVAIVPVTYSDEESFDLVACSCGWEVLTDCVSARNHLRAHGVSDPNKRILGLDGRLPSGGSVVVASLVTPAQLHKTGSGWSLPVDPRGEAVVRILRDGTLEREIPGHGWTRDHGLTQDQADWALWQGSQPCLTPEENEG